MRKLLDYIQGARKGKDAHQLERASFQDEFLKEALDGFDEVKGNHIKSIQQLQNKILAKTQNKKKAKTYWYVAASILILLSLGGYYLLTMLGVNNLNNNIAYERKEETREKIFSPSGKEKYVVPLNTDSTENTIVFSDNYMMSKRKEETVPLAINTNKHISNSEPYQERQSEVEKKDGVYYGYFGEDNIAYERKEKTREKIFSPLGKEKYAVPLNSDSTEDQIIYFDNYKMSKGKEETVPLAINTNKHISNSEPYQERQSEMEKNDSFYYDHLAYKEMAVKSGYKGYKKSVSPLSARISTSKKDNISLDIKEKEDTIISDLDKEQALSSSLALIYKKQVSKENLETKNWNIISQNVISEDTISEDTRISKAQPIIGYEQYNQYIKENITKKVEKCDSVKGKVVISFLVGKDGKPQNIKIKQSLCKLLDNKLIDLVKNGSDWTEGEGQLEYEQ